VLASRFFDAIAERPPPRGSRRSPVRSEGCSQTLQELLAFALELLKLRLSRRPAPDLRGYGRYDAFVILRPDAVAQTLELRGHVGPEMRPGVAKAGGGDAAQECDVLLSWLAVDADAFDQDGLKERALVVPAGMPVV
jgi:hypothetical protein